MQYFMKQLISRGQRFFCLSMNEFNARPFSNSCVTSTEQKMDRDEVLVKLVEHESIIWKRNHPQFKNVTMKEQAWGRVSYQLGISSESLSHTLTHGESSSIVAFCINTHYSPLRFIPFVRMKFCVNPITDSHMFTQKRPISTRVYQFKCLIFVVVTQSVYWCGDKKGVHCLWVCVWIN